jgi:hypothetical protein
MVPLLPTAQMLDAEVPQMLYVYVGIGQLETLDQLVPL